MNYSDMPLSTCPLNQSERERWLDVLSVILRYAGAPGDWGYESKLGMTTKHLIELRQEIANQQPGTARGEV